MRIEPETTNPKKSHGSKELQLSEVKEFAPIIKKILRAPPVDNKGLKAKPE